MIELRHLQNPTTMKKLFLALRSVGTVLIAVALSSTALFAQDKPQILSRPNAGTRAENVVPGYDLQIENGQLLVNNNLTNRINVKARFGPGSIHSVPVTLGDIVDVLRELHTNANADIVMTPGVAKMKITDLKMRSTHESDDTQLQKELQALSAASGYKLAWRREADLAQNPGQIDPNTGLPLTPRSALEADSSLYILYHNEAVQPKPSRSVEVFNLSGYIDQLGKPDVKEIERNVEKIGIIINDTVQRLKGEYYTSEDLASFEFHPGASLLIVIGLPESLDVARKVVTALPGVVGSADAGTSLGGGDRFPPGPDGRNASEIMRKRYGLGRSSSPMPAPPSGPSSPR
jgi:hypothetical protein